MKHTQTNTHPRLARAGGAVRRSNLTERWKCENPICGHLGAFYVVGGGW